MKSKSLMGGVVLSQQKPESQTSGAESRRLCWIVPSFAAKALPLIGLSKFRMDKI